MIDLDFEFDAEIWQWEGHASWHFLSLSVEISEDIKAFTKHLARGFRSVKVGVNIGQTHWQTSLFPDKKQGVYILPLKKGRARIRGHLRGRHGSRGVARTHIKCAHGRLFIFLTFNACLT